MWNIFSFLVLHAFLDTPPIMDDRYSKFYPPLLGVKWRMIYRLSRYHRGLLFAYVGNNTAANTVLTLTYDTIEKSGEEFRPERKGDTCFPFLLFTALRLLITANYGRQPST